MNTGAAYGHWLLVAVNSILLLAFAFSFFRPHTRRDWRTFGAFGAFVVALFVEMYGFPLTIYLFSGWLIRRYPQIDWFSHDSSHLLQTLTGWRGDAHTGPLHLASNLLILGGMILLIIVAAFILNLAISLTGVAEAMTAWVTSFGLTAMQLLFVLIVFYLLLGMFMDVLSMMVATIPITFPIVTHLGVDPVWYGIFIVLMCELGMITPPVGMNLFVVHGIRPDKGGIHDAIVGALPYVVIMIAFTILLMFVPGIATWLPGKM